ncbi:unnamed protein product [Urochloa humidicola]
MAMDKTTIIVCSVVGSLGVLSAILGFSAEGTKLTPNDILVFDDGCIYPQNPALGLGVCAIIFLLVAQITVTAVGGCCGCCKSRAFPSETKRIVAIICAVASWIAAAIAWGLLIQGAAWNANVARSSCLYLKDGIFAGGAVLTLAATALGLTSFIMLRRQTPASAAAPAVHATTGQPQFPPAAAQNKPGEQQPPPHAVVAMGQPQFWPAAAAQAQPQPAGNAMGMGQGHQQQFPPAAAAGAPNKPGEQPPATWAPTGHPQPQFLPPQAYAQPQPMSYPAQHQYHVQPHHQVYMQVPVLPPSVPTPQEQSEAPTGVSGDLVKAGAKLLMRVVENSLSSNDAATTTPTTGDGVQATDNGVVVA